MSDMGSSISVSNIDPATVTPTNYLWVSASAAPGGDGSAGHPFNTIQAAVNVATAGTAVMVEAGTYIENVKFASLSGGTPDKPIQLISADGAGAAKIVAADNSTSTIKGLGVHDIDVKGFEIDGGLNGIQFSQSGSDFTHLVSNIVIQGNTVSNTVQDGIKLSQADNIHVLDNVIAHTGQEGIDFVAVNGSVIARNDVSDSHGAAGIFAKGGSTNDLITANSVHGTTQDGIAIGGWTGAEFFRPGFDTYEAANITVTGNEVSGAANRPVNILGGINSVVTDNYLVANSAYFTAIEVGSGYNKAMVSSNIDISGNTIVGANKTLAIDAGNNNNINLHDNTSAGPMGLDVGSHQVSLWGGTELGLPVAASTNATIPVLGSIAPAPVQSGGVSIQTGTALSETLNGGAGHDALFGGGGNDH